ncbi:zf-HC2 domain-containing protein [Gemmatimonadota bacterium]
MKICPETARLTALREGWLGEEDAKRLRSHLDVCPSCRAAQSDLESILDFIAIDLHDVEPPPGGYEALMDATLKMRDQIVPLQVPAHSRWRIAVIAAAAVLVIAVSSISVLDSGSRAIPVNAEIVEEGDIPDWLIEEHARVSDLLPFSDGSTLMILANQEKR